jgi:anti-sigma B factor antagonist
MSSALHIAVGQETGKVPVTVLYLKGSLDANTSGELESKADELVGEGNTNLLLDLNGLDYMGSAGLRAFNAISHKLKENGTGAVKLLNPSEPVSKVIKTLGFTNFFDIHTDLDSAVNSF